MRPLRACLFLSLLMLAACLLGAPAESEWYIEALRPQGTVDYDFVNDVMTATNGVVIKYGAAVLTAERASVSKNSGWVVADGSVRVENEGIIWVGEHISYNFKTRQMTAEQFRTGKAPVFIEAQKLVGDRTNGVYHATNAVVTTDDNAHPFETMRAKSITIVAGKTVTARNATLYLAGIPVFYVPYYSRPLDRRANYWNFTPGYRSIYGYYMLSSYRWFWGDNWDGQVRLDYRSKRGAGIGFDASGDLGRWGKPTIESYYLYDKAPETNSVGQPYPYNRGLVWLGYQSAPYTNFFIKSQVRYESDGGVAQEFFERLYERNPQPSTYFDFEKLWPNLSLDTYVQPRINNFLQTVERLPEVMLTAYPQQVGDLPVYYQSENSVGYMDRLFAQTSSLPTVPSFGAARADSWHQLSLPQTLLGWLNLEPRVGGRYTYYSEATGPGAYTTDQSRWVFNTGMEMNVKASRAWPGVRNGLLDVEGLRHILQPWVNYAYVPNPSVAAPQLPQFDHLMPSLYPLPIEFPAYNAIDQIGAQNVVRLGLNNKVQTRRGGAVETLFNWSLYADCLLERLPGQTTFPEVFSEVAFRPRTWLTMESLSRYNPALSTFDLASQTVTVSPNSTWSCGLTYYYLRPNFSLAPTAWGQGGNLVSGTAYYRLNQNWGFRLYEYYDVENGRLANQAYSVYRDFRSWTGAFITNIRNNGNGDLDWSVGFTMSLKAQPRFGLGADTVGRNGILGY
jgi:LPS-assembly protein